MPRSPYSNAPSLEQPDTAAVTALIIRIAVVKGGPGLACEPQTDESSSSRDGDDNDVVDDDVLSSWYCMTLGKQAGCL